MLILLASEKELQSQTHYTATHLTGMETGPMLMPSAPGRRVTSEMAEKVDIEHVSQVRQTAPVLVVLSTSVHSDNLVTMR